MLRSRRLLVSVSALTLFMTACGSDEEATPTQTIEVTTTTEASSGGSLSQESIDAALLTPADVGEGYVVEGAGESSDEPTGCAALDAISDRLNEAEIKGEVLLSNETSGDLINQIISVDENAEADFDAFVGAIAACSSFSVDLQGQTVTFTAVPVDEADIGDQSESGRFTATLIGVPVSVDYVVFRKGNLLTAMLATSFDNPEASRIKSLGLKASDKLNAG